VRWASAGIVVALVAAAASAAALAAGPTPSGAASAPKANPCLGVKNCTAVAGPWVAVPASGESDFLLECPNRSGTIGGIDALSTSADVRVVWEGNIGSPVRPGTTTTFLALFHAYSARGSAGLFMPYIGCIPSPKASPRSTVSARVTRPAPAGLDHWQTLVNIASGSSKTVTRGCGKGERLLGAWHTVAFGAGNPPSPALAGKVHVTLAVSSRAVVASIHTDAGMPIAALAEVQVGAVCAK
jgi:hypothetical protein